MKSKTEYAVVCFLEQKGQCYLVHDLVSGYSIMQLASMGTYAKKRVFQWLYRFMICLEQSKKCREGFSSVFINPYTVIISRDDKVYFLDPADRENRELFEKLRKYAKRENNSFRVFHFILERCIDKRKLTYREEKVVERMEYRCRMRSRREKEWEKTKRDLYFLIK